MMNLNHGRLVSMENNLVDVQGMYYSNQRILFIGEGDLSFPSFFATRFGVANNIVATSLDSREVLIKNYSMDAIVNIKNLTDRGAQVFHGIDACKMATNNGRSPLFAFGRSLFDVINYNFPHAGFFGCEDDPRVIRKHTKLVQKFFRNAALLLAPGGVVYVAHKCGPAYDAWNLQENANKHGLEFMGSVPFRKSNFPGYKNRRGSGKRAGDTFELGRAAIYIFALRCRVWIDHIGEHPLKTQNKEQFLLETLRSFKKGGIRASSRTPLLQAIAAEVARLETLQLGPKKQRKLSSLKLVLKAMPLLVRTPAFAVLRIRSLQASSSYRETVQGWSHIQKLALEAMEDAQNIVTGHEKLAQSAELLPELFAEQDMCDGCSNEQQGEEVLEIYVSDDTANGALDDENEDSFGAFVVDTPLACSIDKPDKDSFCAFHVVDIPPPPSSMAEPENIVPTSRGINDIMFTVRRRAEVYLHHELYRSSDDGQSDMPYLEALGAPSRDSENVQDEEGDHGLKSTNLGQRIIDWTIEYLFCCSCWFGMSKS